MPLCIFRVRGAAKAVCRVKTVARIIRAPSNRLFIVLCMGSPLFILYLVSKVVSRVLLSRRAIQMLNMPSVSDQSGTTE
ncbi:hypothetical protein D3C85_1039800 [compost metagenome]